MQTLSTIPSPPSSFRIKEISNTSEYIEKIKTIMGIWSKIADKRANIVSPSEQIYFSNSSEITSCIQYCLEKNPSGNRIFTSWIKNKMQSIAIVDNSSLDGITVDYLATHPHNIRSSHLFKEPQVLYAGTALMHHLFKLCLKENKDRIEVSASLGSMGFYKKLGLHPSRKDQEFGLTVISSKEIQTELKKHQKRLPTIHLPLENQSLILPSKSKTKLPPISNNSTSISELKKQKTRT
ncbi:MAG: hypothetical protein JSS09_02675 [Verrucomicrobia bacterium]|nr:hypothetical protein [Verrucomicrobiota bacterium]